jgi:hypothetical protein
MRIKHKYIQLLNTKTKTLFLGIITEDDEVLLKEASPDSYPGHAEWLSLEPDIKVRYGFSLSARNGHVQAIFRASRLNRVEDGFLLKENVLKKVKKAFPLAEDLTVYGH